MENKKRTPFWETFCFARWREAKVTPKRNCATDPGGVSDTYHPPPQGFYISKGTIGFQKDTIGFQKSQTFKAIKVGENL